MIISDSAETKMQRKNLQKIKNNANKNTETQ